MSVFSEPYRVLVRIYRDGAHLKAALAELPAGEHGRTVRLVYTVLEHDGYLGLCLKTAAKTPKPAVRLILRIGLAAMLFADMPRPVAVNEAVMLVKETGKAGAAGFVNAFLRSFDDRAVCVPDGEAGLAVRSNFPPFAVHEIAARYGARAENILLAKSHGVSVRFVRNMQGYLSLPHTDTPFENVKLFKNFTRDEGFFAGDYTFQSVGSVAICAVAEPCGRLLDACAAPGGKSVLLAEKCKEVVALEIYPHRAALIESYRRRMHAENVAVHTADAAVFDPAYEEAFDGVLCDVPCSGLGTVCENPDLPLRKNEGTMSELCALQRAILQNCSRYVRRGGYLYYSTCTMLDAENDGAVGDFLEHNAGFEAVGAESPLPHEKTKYGLQFLPDTAYGAGFYVAKLRKL